MEFVNELLSHLPSYLQPHKTSSLTSATNTITSAFKSNTASSSSTPLGYINFNDSQLQYTALIALLCPLIWNIVARSIRPYCIKQSRTFQYAACYALTIWIFSFSSYRDYQFHLTLAAQPTHPLLEQYYAIIQPLSVLLIVAGQTLVLSSFYRLGITGTFLGDYCGILMDERVTGFPFSVVEDPMYVGASLSFLGSSLWNKSPAGIVLTVWIYILYVIALQYEGPYTAAIYAEKAKEDKKPPKRKTRSRKAN